MQTGTPSARIDAGNYQSGMIMAKWTGNDALDATIYVQGSLNGLDWGNMGAVIDDVGSVTINTANDSQLWDFQIFPFSFVRLVYASGTNTTGSLTIIFSGSLKAPGI